MARYSLEKSWGVLKTLVSRDFKIKYRRSILGVLWSVLNPLLMMCVLSAVFSAFFKFDIENFPLYLILGTTLFSLMAESTTTAMHSILDSASLIKKIRINKIVFPLEKVVFQLINFALSLVAVLLVMIFFRVMPTVNVLFLPLLLIYMFLFSAGLGMMLAALAVFFRDIVHLWSVVITAWTYATPLFYPVSILPDWMQTFEKFNPMFHYVNYFRDITLYQTTPSLADNLLCFGVGAVVFLVGLLVFKKTESKFILHV